MRRDGYAVGRWLAGQLMLECRLISRQPGKHRYPGVKEDTPASANVLKRRFMPMKPNQGWCRDIRYTQING
jgi:putative transposase